MLGYKFQFDRIINKLVREKSTECFLTPLRLFFSRLYTVRSVEPENSRLGRRHYSNY